MPMPRELLTDLEALRNGQQPLQAHQRFDVSALEQLEEGDLLENERHQEYDLDELNRYKTLTIVLGAVSGISILALIIMAVMKAG